MRNILLFIDDVKEAGNLAKKALKVARQCRANLQLCNAAETVTKRKLLIPYNDDDILLEEHEEVDIIELARQLTITNPPEGVFVPTVDCLEINSFSPNGISEIVIQNNIWLIIMGNQQLNQLKNTEAANYSMKVINNINCPVLVIPQQVELTYFNRISYVTDLRYCDLGVMQFLKVFNAQLFVTHISAPGLPDMEERYAQELLAEEISTKVNYSKMFLRNIRSKNIKGSIDKVLDTLEIKMLALVNKKHQTFERLFDDSPQNRHIYHNLPTLIFPYLNWFHKASFYA
jgi:nucleotide-binding universal stress UspA family protein